MTTPSRRLTTDYGFRVVLLFESSNSYCHNIDIIDRLRSIGVAKTREWTISRRQKLKKGSSCAQRNSSVIRDAPVFGSK